MTNGQNWQPPTAPGAGAWMPPQAAPGQQAPSDPYGQNPYAQNPYGLPPGQNGYGQPQQPFGQPAWAPPPKPGLIPLRPLGFGTLLGAPFQTLRRNPRVTFGSSLLINAVIFLITLVAVGAVTAWATFRIVNAAPEDQDAVAAGSMTAVFISSLVPIVISLAASAFLQGVIVVEVARATLGEKLKLGAVWKITWPRLGRLLLWMLLITVALIVAVGVFIGITVLFSLLGGGFVAVAVLFAILASIGAFVVAIWVGTKLSLVPSIIVLEKAKVLPAVKRSWSLTTGYFWKTFGVQTLVAVMTSIVTQIVTTPISMILVFSVGVIDPVGNPDSLIVPILFYVLTIVVSFVLGAITMVVTSATTALIYIDLRMRKEGLDLELIRFVEARSTGDTSIPDPYLSAPRHPSPRAPQPPYLGPGYPGAGQQPYPGQPYPGQPYPAQSYPAQPYPGQPYPAQPYPGAQPVPGQPYPPSAYAPPPVPYPQAQPIHPPQPPYPPAPQNPDAQRNPEGQQPWA